VATRRPTHILVVDDDFDLREAVADILRDEGFDVVEASNGAEALEQVARRKPDVMVLDLMMPVVDGWQVLRTIRESPEFSALPVVVLSALSAPGCAEFIQKPVSLDRLLTLLETVGARHRSSA
jgi:CheY-like chemotaxis protein